MKINRLRRTGGLAGTFALLAVGTTGCESMSNTAKDGLVGGGIGAGAGALIGSASHNAGKGALIGGLAGTAIGGIVGNDKDQQEKKQAQAQLAAAQAKPAMTLNDIVTLARSGTVDEVIINQIKTTGSTYNLTTEDIQFLQGNGVSIPVITFMQNARKQTVVVAPPPPPQVVYVRPAPPPPVYYVPPPPPPPPPGISVGIGIR